MGSARPVVLAVLVFRVLGGPYRTPPPSARTCARWARFRADATRRGGCGYLVAEARSRCFCRRPAPPFIRATQKSASEKTPMRYFRPVRGFLFLNDRPIFSACVLLVRPVSRIPRPAGRVFPGNLFYSVRQPGSGPPAEYAQNIRGIHAESPFRV